MGHVSIRESIRWLPDEASEPTSTMVLTSPGRLFVDLRFYNSDDGSIPDIESGQVLPLTRLEWAIAGTSALPTTPDPVDHHWRGRWEHWIDSRTINARGVADEGDMYPLAGGKTLEKGRMVNPATGIETDYEEVWLGGEVVPVSTESNVTCVVLQLENDAKKRWGRIVRLGRYAQGFVRVGEEVLAERWMCDSGGDGGAWQMKVKIGDTAEIPMDFVTRFGHEAEVGDEVEVGQDAWTVVEKS